MTLLRESFLVLALLPAALDVLRLMDHLGIHRAHVVGYSMGARVTAYILANHPDRFITATLGCGFRAKVITIPG